MYIRRKTIRTGNSSSRGLEVGACPSYLRVTVKSRGATKRKWAEEEVRGETEFKWWRAFLLHVRALACILSEMGGH